MKYLKSFTFGITLWVLIFSLLLSMVAVTTTQVVYAGDGEKDRHNIGDKIALESGDEATYVGDGQWQAVLGDPVYVKGTSTPYDCRWYLEDGQYVAGANDFTATISLESVSIEHKGKNANWQPQTKVASVNAKAKTDTPTLLLTDPLNSNYYNNTLMWDYGNGVKRYLRIIEGMLIEYYVIEHPLNNDFDIESHLIKESGFDWFRNAQAWDAENNPIELEDLGNHNYKLSKDNALIAKNGKNVVYPIIIDPDTTFYTSSSDGSLSAGSDFITVWNTIRTKATCEDYYTSAITLLARTLGFDLAGTPYYYIARVPVYFDTSALPDDATLTDAELYMYIESVLDDDNAGMYIVSGMPTYPHDPMTNADYGYTNYGSFASNYGYYTSPSAGSYNKVNSSNNGTLVNIINKTGYTKLLLIERHDYVNETPAAGEYNAVSSYSYEKGVGYRPKLVVTYALGTPEISVEPASNVAMESARLNALVVSDGYESCQVRWGYGTTNQTAANFTLYDTVTSWTAAVWDTDEHPYLDVTGLSGNTTYYYRAQIKNTSYNGTSSNSETFTTEYYVDEPSNVRAYPSDDSIDLSWVKGIGSTNTTIRYSLDTFPTTNSTGILLYNGVGQTTTHTGLDEGVTYFYSLWGRSSANWSSSYATVAATTFIIEPTTEDLTAPSAPDDWFQEPDYTNLSNLEPLYSAVNGVADSMGTPRNTAWIGLVLFAIAIMSLIIMAKVGFEAGVIASAVMLVAGVIIHILPVWFLLFSIIIAVFGWTLLRRGNA